MKRLLTYTTFFITRNPFQRLVSAHKSKFEDPGGSLRKVLGIPIAFQQAEEYLPDGMTYIKTRDRKKLINDPTFLKLNATQQKEVQQYMEIMNTGQISFRQFTNFVGNLLTKNESKDKYEYHWRPQLTLCNPCVVNYDFVVRFETMGNDGNHLLKYLQRNDPEEKRVFFDSSHTATVDEARAAKAFKNVRAETLEKLKKIYWDDFKIMGYDFP